MIFRITSTSCSVSSGSSQNQKSPDLCFLAEMPDNFYFGFFFGTGLVKACCRADAGVLCFPVALCFTLEMLFAFDKQERSPPGQLLFAARV